MTILTQKPPDESQSDSLYSCDNPTNIADEEKKHALCAAKDDIKHWTSVHPFPLQKLHNAMLHEDGLVLERTQCVDSTRSGIKETWQVLFDKSYVFWRVANFVIRGLQFSNTKEARQGFLDLMEQIWDWHWKQEAKRERALAKKEKGKQS